VSRAFEFAREAAVRLVTSLRERGIPVDGIGEQGHWLLDDPPLEEIETALVDLAKTGKQISITELDIDPLPRLEELVGADVSKRVELTPELNPYVNGLPEELQQRLARRYRDIFSLFVKHRAVVSRVTFWGVTDADTWLNHWPVPGRTYHPLLWGRQGRPKPAFGVVVEALRDTA